MPSAMEEMLAFNKSFVEGKEYKQYCTDKLPDKRLAVLSCMDTRLTELLPAALNFKNGDVKLIKNAGGGITHPFGSVMRSLLVCVYTLGVDEIAVIGHHDCGMHHFNPQTIRQQMLERGIPQERLEIIQNLGFDLDHWLAGFEDAKESVERTVSLIHKHPLLPTGILVQGFLIYPDTGKVQATTQCLQKR